MIQNVTNAMIDYFGTDVGLINHALKVYGFASTICRSEGLSQAEIEIIETTALLHDIGIPESEKKYGSCLGKYQEQEGPPIARLIMEKLDIKPAIVERVCFIIGNHHTYSKIDNIDFQIIVEADFLVNIHENAMDKSAIESVYEKYFKTANGRKIVRSVYDIKNE